MDLSLNHVVAADEVGLGHMSINFRGVDVAVTEHALHNLNRDAGAEADGGGEGVASAVGGELLSQIHFLAKDRQLPVVANIAAVWQFEVVLLQYVEDDGKQDDGVALVSLLAMVVDEPMSLYLFPLGKVDVEQVDVCEAGVT